MSKKKKKYAYTCLFEGPPESECFRDYTFSTRNAAVACAKRYWEDCPDVEWEMSTTIYRLELRDE